MTNYIISTEGLDQIQFQTNRCAPFLPSAPLVAERQCFPKSVSRILSGGEGGAWGGRGICGGGRACVAGEMATATDSTHHTGMHSCSLYFEFQDTCTFEIE